MESPTHPVSPPPPTDAALLDRFAAGELGLKESEAAFAEVVSRHSRLVYATARRVLRSHDEAQDVSQKVFTLLARKVRTGLAVRDSVAGWLHRAAVNCSREALRAQRTRTKLETAAASIPGQTSQPQDAALAVLLDEALTTMPEPDRDLILRRYGEGLSCRELSAETGKSEAAVQKQAVRALEKLAARLRQRGVIVPAAAISTILGAAGSSKPVAAAELAARALAATATGSRGSVLSGLFAAMKLTKFTWAAALLAFFAPLVVRSVSPPSPSARLKEAPSRGTAARTAKPEAPIVSAGKFPDDLLKEMAAVNAAKEPQRFLKLVARLGTLTKEEVPILWQALRAGPEERQNSDAMRALFARWAELDAAAAIQTALDPVPNQLAARWTGIASVLVPKEGAGFFARIVPGGAVPWDQLPKPGTPLACALSVGFSSLGESDPVKGIELLSEAPAEAGVPHPLRRNMEVRTMIGAAAFAPDASWAALQKVPDTKCREALIEEFCSQLGQCNPAKGVEIFLRPENALHAEEGLPKVMGGLISVNPEKAISTWAGLSPELRTREITAGMFGGMNGMKEAVMNIWQPMIDTWKTQDPASARTWQRENEPLIRQYLTPRK